jgi:Domain of unknown function (DUF4153)
MWRPGSPKRGIKPAAPALEEDWPLKGGWPLKGDGMEDSTGARSGKKALPLILLAAVIQGWALYGLHHAITGHFWPATDQAWLHALCALAVFVPITIQILAEHARNAALWRLVAILAGAYFYFGWHYGVAIHPGGAESIGGGGEYFAFAFVLTVLWLMALPFAQIRLTTGHWRIQYPALFTSAWRNKLALAEAGLFTGLFWLLLFLWQMLFHMLGIDYFRELFQEPIFVYPVTSLTFGCALHSIGSIERLTSVILEHLLSVLKWLGPVAGVILACFTIALLFHLPGLVFTGQKAIGANWLLWLTAVVVLLLNAAYRDGLVSQPYPTWLAQSMRMVVPLTVIISLTALYALATRARHYGLTVERVWGFVVAGAALLYSAGYSIAAVGRGAWLGGIARVNVAVAVALIAVISAASTPLLSPYRLAANSQFRLIREKGLAAAEDKSAGRFTAIEDSRLHYLRFDSGQYGRAKLQELAGLQTGPDADNIRRSATRLLAQKTRWEAPPPGADIAAMLAKLRIYPAGRVIDQPLIDKLTVDLAAPMNGIPYFNLLNRAAGIYVDLNGDKSEEFLFLSEGRGLVYEKRAGRWVLAGDAFAQGTQPTKPKWDLVGELDKGDLTVTPPTWNELSIGGRKFRVESR